MNKKAALVLSIILIALLPLINSDSNYALSAKSKKDSSSLPSSFSQNKSQGIIDGNTPVENKTLPINKGKGIIGGNTPVENNTSPINPVVSGKLLVTKKVINQGGGTNKPSDFTISVSGNNPSPASFSGSASGTTVTLNKGKYSINETGPAGYNLTSSSQCSGTINGNEIRKCTLTNTFAKSPSPPPNITGTLQVTKEVINQGGGTNKPSDFTISVSGNNPSPASFSGSASGTTVQLTAGKYSVTETGQISADYVPGKYTPSYSSDCNGTIKSGETKNCIITNKYNPFIPGLLSKLLVTKKVINQGGGTNKPSDFTISVSGNNPSPASFSGSASGTTVQLTAGKYSVTETGQISADYVH